LSHNIWISLYEERPKIFKEKDTSAGALEGAEIKKVVIKEGLPVFETHLIGTLRVKTDDWVFNSSLKPNQLLTYQK